MQKKSTITSQLGITQQELAALLGINRSQWSMFESGKRSLPLSATLLLNELLSQVQNTAPTGKQLKAEAPAGNLKQFEKLHLEVEYQLEVIIRKIDAIKKKQLSSERLLQLSTFLTERNQDKSEMFKSDLIAAKASKVDKSTDSDALALHEYHKEVLEFEKQLLESKLQTLRKASDE